MSSSIYRVTHGGPGNIKWEKLSEFATSSGQPLQMIGSASSVLSAGLSLVAVVQNQVIISKLNTIGADVRNVKARFDLLLLDRSIEYFINCHRDVRGLDRSLLAALHDDCQNAMRQLIANQDLNLPGYLKHRVLQLTGAIQDFNQLLYGLAHNGSSSRLLPDQVSRWASEIRSLQGANPDGGLCTQKEIVESWRNELASRTSQEQKKFKIPFLKDDAAAIDLAVQPENYSRTIDVVVLARETEMAARLVEIVSDRLAKAEEALLLTTGS